MSYFGYWLHCATKLITVHKRTDLLKVYKTAETIFKLPLNTIKPFGITQEMHNDHFNIQALNLAKQHIDSHKGVLYVKVRWPLLLRPMTYVTVTRQLSKVGELMIPKVSSHHFEKGMMIATGIAAGIEHQVLQAAIKRGRFKSRIGD